MSALHKIIDNLRANLWERDKATTRLSTELMQLTAENRRYREALEEIAMYKGMTNLADCCVEKACFPHFEDGKLVSHCAFQSGVLRGFNTCAHEAEEALAQVGKE